MNQRIAIELRRATAFGVVVRKAGTSAFGRRFRRRRQRQDAAREPEALMAVGGQTTGVAVAVEMPPVGAVGLLSGDGMWVGAGGVSFLPARPTNKNEKNYIQYRTQ